MHSSGSTGKPKGCVHTTGAYMVYGALSFKYVFDYFPGDIFFCTGDIGWLTGHTYIVYGSLLNTATCILVSISTSFCIFKNIYYRYKILNILNATKMKERLQRE